MQPSVITITMFIAKNAIMTGIVTMKINKVPP